MDAPPLSPTELAVLGLLAEGPTHGFAIAKGLASGTSVGRVLTVRRPLVYRALDRLVALELAEPVHSEPGDAGPQRLIHRVTGKGRSRLNHWLAEPVEHVRDMRIEFQLKLVLLERSGKSPLALVRAQRRALGPTLSALEGLPATPIDHLELWRQHNATAAASYLDHLESIYTTRG